MGERREGGERRGVPFGNRTVSSTITIASAPSGTADPVVILAIVPFSTCFIYIYKKNPTKEKKKNYFTIK